MQTVDGLEDALVAQTEHAQTVQQRAEHEWERAKQATEHAQQAIERVEIAQNNEVWWRNVYYQVRVAHETHCPIEPTLY